MPNPTSEELQDLWNQVVERIQPYSTHLFIKGKSELDKFDYVNKTAVIRVNSILHAKHYRAHYMENIRLAFANVLGFPVDVSIVCQKEDEERGDFEARRQRLLKLVEENPVPTGVSARESAQDLAIEFIRHASGQSSVGVGDGNNQGLGGEYQWNGLHFRSKTEIRIAQALDERGVLYFPNAKGRLSLEYSRVNREADFLVCYEGAWGILECDGEMYHQSAANDHARDMVWNANGIWFIKRFSSAECYDNPTRVVDMFLKMLKLFASQTGKAQQ